MLQIDDMSNPNLAISVFANDIRFCHFFKCSVLISASCQIHDSAVLCLFSRIYHQSRIGRRLKFYL